MTSLTTVEQATGQTLEAGRALEQYKTRPDPIMPQMLLLHVAALAEADALIAKLAEAVEELQGLRDFEERCRERLGDFYVTGIWDDVAAARDRKESHE